MNLLLDTHTFLWWDSGKLERHVIRHIQTAPPHHRDPFARIVVAQALLEKLTIVTKDPLIQRYAIAVAWA